MPPTLPPTDSPPRRPRLTGQAPAFLHCLLFLNTACFIGTSIYIKLLYAPMHRAQIAFGQRLMSVVHPLPVLSPHPQHRYVTPCWRARGGMHVSLLDVSRWERAVTLGPEPGSCPGGQPAVRMVGVKTSTSCAHCTRGRDCPRASLAARQSCAENRSHPTRPRWPPQQPKMLAAAQTARWRTH